MFTPHIAGYETVLSDAIDRAIEFCQDRESDGVSATDLAYIYQTVQPDSDVGAKQYPALATFWRLVYRRMIGTDLPLTGLDLNTVEIPEAFYSTEVR